MNLFALILYGAVNVAMVFYYLSGRGRFYQFPFWAGIIALGWFFPQAIGGYHNTSEYPPNAYVDSMVFASLCTLALWVGFLRGKNKVVTRSSWITADFDLHRLYYVAVFLSVAGFFFQWRLWSLPEDLLAASQWSGAAVKYLFLASIFKFGFLTLWLMYLSQPKWIAPKLLLWIVPCLLFLLEAALLRGRRSEMMNLFAYLVVGLWLVRRISIPRWVVSSMMVAGLIFINGIGTYRSIMKNKEIPLSERLNAAASADYLSASKESVDKSGAEFENYIYFRQAYTVTGIYDFGLTHWNNLIYNYVPAQIVGSELKDSLYVEPTERSAGSIVMDLFGHRQKTGTTHTGYKDAFGSFGWFGFIKFGLIGYIMGVLYRRAFEGKFLGQLLYVYTLTTAMQSITHGTNSILVRIWVYFFMLCYPALYWAMSRGSCNAENVDMEYDLSTSR